MTQPRDMLIDQATDARADRGPVVQAEVIHDLDPNSDDIDFIFGGLASSCGETHPPKV